LSTFAILIPGFWSLRYAEQINNKLAQQRLILADKRLRLCNQRFHLEQEGHPQVRAGRSILIMEKIIRMLEYEKYRIRVLGYEIDTTVTGIFAAVLGSVGFTAARLLLKSNF